MKSPNVFRKSVTVAVFLLLATSAQAGKRSTKKPPLMPARLVDSESQTATSAPEPVRPENPIRLGFSAGAVVMVPDLNQPFAFGDTFVGGRIFSRVWMGGRWYISPSVAYYRRIGESTSSSESKNLVEFGLGLNLALFRIGPVGMLLGLTQRAGWHFAADSSGIRGIGYYRVGPGVGINIRLDRSSGILLGTDFVFPLSGPMQPEWTPHAGVLIAL